MRVLLIALLFSATAVAQIKGVRASVTSLPAHGGYHNPHGVGASVSSLGPYGYNELTFTPPPTHLDCRGMACYPVTYPSVRPPRVHPIVYPVYYPVYYPPVIIINGAQPEPRPAYVEPEPPAPTIFERRASTRPYARDERPSSEPDDDRYGEHSFSEQRQPAPRDEEPPLRSGDISAVSPEEGTLFVLLDGTQYDLANYAIVAAYIYNFDGAGPRRIPIAQLDLEATVRANDERGIDFRLPR